MHFTYCPHCGKKLEERCIGDEGLVPWCDSCRLPLFDIPETCTITLAVNEFGEAALLRQNYVSTDTFVCVAGHIKTGETAEETALREVEEEIGIKPEEVAYLGSYYYPRKDMLMLGYWAKVKKADFCISGEVDAAEWFPLETALKKVRQGSIAMQLIVDYMEKERKLKTGKIV